MDRVDLTHEFGVDRQRRWASGGAAGYDFTTVTFGRLSDARWFAGRSGWLADVDDRQQGACAFGTDARGHTLALRLAYSWMREGELEPVPASFDGYGRPADGLTWRRAGGGRVLRR